MTVWARRWRDQQNHLDELPSSDRSEWNKYMGHMEQLYNQRTYLRSLIDEYNHGPCRGDGLGKGAIDWAYREDPAIESGDPLLRHAMQNPPSASSSIDVGPNWLAVLAGVGVVGQIIFAPETLPLDLAA